LLHELDISYREDHHKPIFSVESDDLDIPGPQVKYLLLQPKKTYEMGWLLRQSAPKQGIGREVSEALIEYGFRTLALKRIVAY
ncbi:GNAT family N-acetyltransferase, partial [Erysipelothrix rhusiopathiae]|nr:GNAT family N-acetyltransferase [Erysipelothrix rhusiopathiae]